jgi:cell division protein FtsN
MLLFHILFPSLLNAQEQQDYDEILVYVEIPRMGGFEIPAVIKKNDLYLSIHDLFDFVKVKNTVSSGLDSLSGFFINPEAKFIISYRANKITFQERIYTVVEGDLIRTESGLYLKSEYFGRIFGLECNFNFRALTATIVSKLELPVIREMRLEEMRRNITRLKGETKADTNIVATRRLFRFGMADWGIYTDQEINGKANGSVNIGLGAMLAGGEATASLYYNSRNKFSEKNQQYLWRYVDNDFKPIKQFMAGKINTHAISSLFNPVLGIQFTNTPTTFRRSFGSYKLSDYTQPGWIVELYINNVLVDYVKSDASGFFTFDVPLVYGNSSVKLKFYGPWGEERTKEQNINIPFNFLPKKTLEYNIGAGVVEDSVWSRFSRANVNYGLTKTLTVGGGAEYLSSVTSGPFMPFITSSFRLGSNIILSGEYTYGVRAKGSLQYRLPTNMQIDLNYVWYDRNQTAINYTYREERRGTLTIPLRIGKAYTYQRFTLNQIVLPTSNYTTGEWMFSGSLFGVNANLTTYAYLSGFNDAFVYSNLSLAFRLPADFVIMPQVQWKYSQNSLISAKARVEKTIGNQAYLYLQYEKYFNNNLSMFELGARYDFSFAQAGASFRQYNQRSQFVQYARGSIINDSKTNYLKTENRPNVGRGGITLIAYLDVNSNGGRDPGEPRVKGLNVNVNGGRIISNERDTTIRILSLEPYTSCLIELDQSSFDDISWRLPVKTLSVMVDPEILKVIEIPVSVVGEISGTINLKEAEGTRGLGRIVVAFYNSFNQLTGRTLSEEDGFYNYLGLPSGEYTVRPDSVQMRRLGFRVEPAYRSITVKPGKEGDYISDVNFVLSKVKPDTAGMKQLPDSLKTLTEPVVKPVQPAVRKDTSIMIVHEVTQELVTVGEDSYAIQLGAFRRRSNADAFRKKLEAMLGKKVEIIVENDLYKVRITDIKERSEVDAVIATLQKNGISELWLITMRAKQKQWMLIEKSDTIATITEVEAGAEISNITPDISIQVGAFRQEANANQMKQKISAIVGKPVSIVREDGYFKVRVSGFTSMEELQAMVPELRKMGLNDIWVPPVKKQPEIIKPAVQTPDTAISRPVTVIPPAKAETDSAFARIDTAMVKFDTAAVKVDTATAKVGISQVIADSAIAKADTAAVRPVEKPAEEPAPEIQQPVAKPKISLHVGEFRSRSQALRAQRKVESKFGLPVDIFIRWDSYHLVITGFEKREDTFPYYPELAGMGYTNIYVIQEK